VLPGVGIRHGQLVEDLPLRDDFRSPEGGGDGVDVDERRFNVADELSFPAAIRQKFSVQPQISLGVRTGALQDRVSLPLRRVLSAAS